MMFYEDGGRFYFSDDRYSPRPWNTGLRDRRLCQLTAESAGKVHDAVFERLPGDDAPRGAGSFRDLQDLDRSLTPNGDRTIREIRPPQAYFEDDEPMDQQLGFSEPFPRNDGPDVLPVSGLRRRIANSEGNGASAGISGEGTEEELASDNSAWSPYPVPVKCPVCEVEDLSYAYSRPDMYTRVLDAVLKCIGCCFPFWPVKVVPDVMHICCHCRFQLGVYRYKKQV